MKVATIAGFLGSGKTTFLIELAQVLVERGHKIAIIVNDIGEINVDAKFIEMYGLEAKEISGGCICCQIAGTFANTVAALYHTFNPDIILVEPTGVAIPWGLKRAAEYAESDMDILLDHAPVVALLDAPRIDEMMKSVRRLVETQIREADVVLINKIDAATEENIKKSTEFVRAINTTAELMYISGRSGEGVQEVADIFEKRTSARYDDTYEAEILKKGYGGGGAA
jgi:G3E family GTPase